MATTTDQVANQMGQPTVIKRRPPETPEERREKIRRIGVGVETPGVKRIEEPTEVKFAKAVSALSPGVTEREVLERVAPERVEEARRDVAAPPLAPTVAPEVTAPKQFVVQTTPAGQFLVVETIKGKRFIPGVVPEIQRQVQEIEARGETPENFNVVVARFLETPEGKKFVSEAGLTKEQLVGISRKEEITQAIQEDIESGRLEEALRTQALKGDVAAAVTLAGRELLIGRQVARAVGDPEAAAREEAEVLAGLVTAKETGDVLGFTGTALGETITGQLGVGLAAGAGIGAAGVVAATALKGTKVAQVAAKVPLVAKATKVLARPAVQKGLVVGTVGGIEAVKVGTAIAREEPVAKIAKEVTKDVLFLGGTIKGFQAAVAAAKAPVTPGKIEFTTKAFGRQFQTGEPTRVIGVAKTQATITPPQTRAEALLKKPPKEITFGVKEGFVSRIEGQDVTTLFLKPGEPVVARPAITRTVAEFKPPTPSGIITRRVVTAPSLTEARVGQVTQFPVKRFKFPGGEIVKGKEVSAALKVPPKPAPVVEFGKVKTKIFVPKPPGPPARIPKAPPAVPKTPEDALKLALKRVEDVKDVSRIGTVTAEKQVLLTTPKPRPPAVKAEEVGALQDITRQRGSEIVRSQYDKLYDTAGDEVSGGFIGPGAKQITKQIPDIDVGKIRPTPSFPLEKIKPREELKIKPVVETTTKPREDIALKLPAILQTVAPPKTVIETVPSLAVTPVVTTTTKQAQRIVPVVRTSTIYAPPFRPPPIGGFPFLGLPPLRAGGGGTPTSGKLRLGRIRKTKISGRRKKVERNIGFLSEGISKTLYGKATLPKEKAARGEVIFKPSAELKRRGINVGGFLAKGGLFAVKKKPKKKKKGRKK